MQTALLTGRLVWEPPDYRQRGPFAQHFSPHGFYLKGGLEPALDRVLCRSVALHPSLFSKKSSAKTEGRRWGVGRRRGLKGERWHLRRLRGGVVARDSLAWKIKPTRLLGKQNSAAWPS